jgi:HSP20 family protein
MAVSTRRPATTSPQMERWNPLRDLEELYATTGQVMENILSNAPVSGAIWAPPVDIEETDDAWVVEADLPGAEQDGIDVEVRDSELTITGEIKERERKGILRRRTRRVGRFEFRVALPGGVDPDQVEANLHGGVLTVRVPKPERARSGRVEVKSE